MEPEATSNKVHRYERSERSWPYHKEQEATRLAMIGQPLQPQSCDAAENSAELQVYRVSDLCVLGRSWHRIFPCFLRSGTKTMEHHLKRPWVIGRWKVRNMARDGQYTRDHQGLPKKEKRQT